MVGRQALSRKTEVLRLSHDAQILTHAKDDLQVSPAGHPWRLIQKLLTALGSVREGRTMASPPSYPGE